MTCLSEWIFPDLRFRRNFEGHGLEGLDISQFKYKNFQTKSGHIVQRSMNFTRTPGMGSGADLPRRQERVSKFFKTQWRNYNFMQKSPLFIILVKNCEIFQKFLKIFLFFCENVAKTKKIFLYSFIRVCASKVEPRSYRVVWKNSRKINGQMQFLKMYISYEGIYDLQTRLKIKIRLDLTISLNCFFVNLSEIKKPPVRDLRDLAKNQRRVENFEKIFELL